MHEELIKHIISLGRNEAQYIQKEVENFFEANTQNFMNSLEKDDLTSAKEQIKNGIIWESRDLWVKLYRKWRSQHTSEEISSFIYMLKPNAIFSTFSTKRISLTDVMVDIDDKTYQAWKTNPSLKTFFNYLIDKELEPQDVRSTTSIFVLKNIFFNYRQNLDNKNYFNNFCKSFAKHNIEENIDILEYLIKKSPTKLLYFIDNTNNIHHKFFQSIYKTLTFSENEKNTLMAKLMSEGNVEKIKFLHNLGVDFPNNKKGYSDLFSTPRKIEACRYVLDCLDNPSIGDNVILKTVLHHNNKDIVEELMSKYPLELLPSLQKILEGREENFCFNYVKSAIVANSLEKKLPINSVDNIKIKI